MKYLQTYEKFYVTHDNGGRPFSVYKEDDRTYIYKQSEYLTDVEKVFSGEDNCAILTKIKGENKYIFVGTEVYEFTTEEPITKFIAKIGNSDVPYPYAYSKNYFYQFLDKVYCEKEILKGNLDDPYKYFYENEDDIETKGLDNLNIMEVRK